MNYDRCYFRQQEFSGYVFPNVRWKNKARGEEARRIVRLRGGQCQGDQLISLSMRGLRNELEARCTDSASVSPMCLTCDVKVAGTGACKAVLNICQASSALHLSIDRRVFHLLLDRSLLDREEMYRLWCEISVSIHIKSNILKESIFPTTFCSIVVTIFDEFRNRYIYASLYVTRYTLCISSVYTKNWWNLKYLLEWKNVSY